MSSNVFLYEISSPASSLWWKSQQKILDEYWRILLHFRHVVSSFHLNVRLHKRKQVSYKICWSSVEYLLVHNVSLSDECHILSYSAWMILHYCKRCVVSCSAALQGHTGGGTIVMTLWRCWLSLLYPFPSLQDYGLFRSCYLIVTVDCWT